jgi:HD superfamily phosphodiesterase
MKKLNYFFDLDPRLKEVYDYSKEMFTKANLCQHNFKHILRVLYRSLLISEHEENVNFSVLIAAALLHDISYALGKPENHELESSKISEEVLSNFDFTSEEIEKISGCIESHGRNPEPKTIEAKILHDADKLEKSGYASVFCTYRTQQELKIPLEKWIKKRLSRIDQNIEEGYYTEYALKMCNNGIEERKEHFKRVLESLEKRKDFLIKEEDLFE